MMGVLLVVFKDIIESDGKLDPLVGREIVAPSFGALGIGMFFPMPHARFPMPKNSMPQVAWSFSFSEVS
jgi:hypothetical protein